MSFREVDRVLRGAGGETDAGVTTIPGRLTAAVLLLAAGYGACMGVFALTRPDGPEFRQVLASTVKVPALIALTVAVTFPSLYVFNTLLGSRLGVADLTRLVITANAVLVAVLAGFGLIVAFFSVTTTSYPFVLLLNVGVFVIAAGFGGAALWKTLSQLRPVPEVGPDDALPVARRVGRLPTASRVFVVWMVLFAVVAAQMGWVLRPFVGSPDLPFTWFRPRQGSVIEGVAKSVHMLFRE